MAPVDRFMWPCGTPGESMPEVGHRRFGECPLNTGHAPPCLHPDRTLPLLAPVVPKLHDDTSWLTDEAA